MKFNYVFSEVKKLYPKMTDEEIKSLIDEALDQNSLQEAIINYICYVKVRLGR